MACTNFIIRISGWLMVLITVAMAEVPPLLQHNWPSNRDSRWIRQLPPATVSLPKSLDYRELPQIPAASIPSPKIITPPALVESPIIPIVSQPELPKINITSPPPPQLESPGLVTTEVENEDLPEQDASSVKNKITFWQIVLMEGHEIESLRAYRQSFIAQYADLLQEHEPIISADESATNFRLRLKPILNEKAAQNWCASLKKRGNNNCLITKIVRNVSSTTWLVQVIAQRSFVELKRYQKYFESRYGNLLKDYQLIITLNNTGEYFRLRVRAMAQEALAKNLCVTLKKRGEQCLVIKSIPLGGKR